MVLRVALSPAGEIVSVTVAAPLSPAFDAAAERAVRQCSFTGASRGGVPAGSQMEIGIHFAAPPKPKPPEPEPEPEPPKPPEPKAPELSATVNESRLLPHVPEPDPAPVLGSYLLDRADIDRAPGAMEDVSRAVATLPGVVSDPDLLATFTVRGGAATETIDYLDGVPLSNPFHLGGFASIYNPMLVSSARFFAGATPPRYDASLSGALDVSYLSGETHRLRVEGDLSMQTAKVAARIPTGVEGLSVSAAFRRSFFELYFGALRAAHVISADYVAPDISESFGRAYWDLGAHKLTLTFLRATDGFSFLLKPGEKPLFGNTSGLQLSNLLQLGALTDQVALGRAALTLTFAVTHDASNTTVSSQSIVARDVAQLDVLGRADLSLPLGESGRAGAGVQFSHRRYDFRGQVSDQRGVAPWAAFPLVETGQGNVKLTSDAPTDEPAAYAELELRPLPALATALGGRLQAPSGSRSKVYSARAAAAWTLPTQGVLKAEAGVATQLPANVLLLQPGYGNPDLLPERSRQLLVALEQPLPIGALLRLEAFSKWFDRLAVNPDSSSAAPVFESSGTGSARGVDLLLAGRTPRFSWGASAGLLFADRTNPLASGRATYPTAWDQRLTTAANVSYLPADRWIVSVRASFHTGRPYTPVTGFTRDDAGQRYLPVFGKTNSARYASFFEASARTEHRFMLGGLSMAWYAEVLNLTNATNIFALTYDSGDFPGGVQPSSGSFNHLPIRPFLGVRGEY